MVMPRSRSMSIESSIWSWNSRSLTAPQRSSRRSASVLLPWSIWAMIEKLRINDRSVMSHSFGPRWNACGPEDLTSQCGAGCLDDLRHDLAAHRLDLRVGQGALDRLQRDGDGE